MIVDLPNTNLSKVSKKIVQLRAQGGVTTLSRVLTLVISTTEADVEEAIEAANDASREHPSRIIVVSSGNPNAENRIDAQIRVGGDAGASEVIVLRGYGELANPDIQDGLITPFLLPDAPIVAWWPGLAPRSPAQSPIGRLAQRRITDAAKQADPLAFLTERAASYAPGDTDLAWSRLTPWRTQLAAAMDRPKLGAATASLIKGSDASPSAALLSAWLTYALAVPTEFTPVAAVGGAGISEVRIQAGEKSIDITRTTPSAAKLSFTGQPEQKISLARRTLSECIAEELRRLDSDEVYGEVLAALAKPAKAAKKAPARAAPAAAADKADAEPTT